MFLLKNCHDIIPVVFRCSIRTSDRYVTWLGDGRTGNLMFSAASLLGRAADWLHCIINTGLRVTI